MNKIIKVRLIADKNNINSIAEKTINTMAVAGFKFIEKSKKYPCRPPNENESRIYLTFENTDPNQNNVDAIDLRIY